MWAFSSFCEAFWKIVCAHAWMCLCICVWCMCSLSCKNKTLPVPADRHRSFSRSYHIDMSKCELSTQTILREEELTLPEIILSFFLFGSAMTQYLCCAGSILHKILFPREYCAREMCAYEWIKQNWRETLAVTGETSGQAESKVFFSFLWPDDRNVSHCF